MFLRNLDRFKILDQFIIIVCNTANNIASFNIKNTEMPRQLNCSAPRKILVEFILEQSTLFSTNILKIEFLLFNRKERFYRYAHIGCVWTFAYFWKILEHAFSRTIRLAKPTVLFPAHKSHQHAEDKIFQYMESVEAVQDTVATKQEHISEESPK